MTVQTVTRQTLLNRAVEIIGNLPDDRLQQAWEQINSWPSIFSKPNDDSVNLAKADKEEILEFVVNSPISTGSRFVRLPVRVQGVMPKVKMEVGEPILGESDCAI